MLADSRVHILCHVSRDFISAAGNGNEVINDPSRARANNIPRAYPPSTTQDLPLLWPAASGVAVGFSHVFLSVSLSFYAPSPGLEGRCSCWEARCGVLSSVRLALCPVAESAQEQPVVHRARQPDSGIVCLPGGWDFFIPPGYSGICF